MDKEDTGALDPKVDPQVRALLTEMRRLCWPPLSSLTPEQARELWRVPAVAAVSTATLDVQDLTVPGGSGHVSARLFRPRTGRSPRVLVFFHGGGFCLESIDSHDGLCRAVAEGSETATLSVGYRLAPENPFPAAVEDAVSATRWAAAHAHELCGCARPSLIVGGDSAGGNLAAVVCQLLRGDDPAIALQWLAYPVLDWADMENPSYRRYERGYGFNRDEAIWFRAHYLGHEGQALDPRASPLRSADLAGLPPALIQTAEHDVLRDEAHAYAQALRRAGVPVRYTCYRGLVHAFYGMHGSVERVNQALDEACRVLQSIGGSGAQSAASG